MTARSAERDWSTILAGEALMFGLLSKALYAEPDRTWLQSLVDEDLFTDTPFAGSQPDVQAGLALLREWSAAWHNGAAGEALDGLQADYTRLFVGPGKVVAPPWESIYFNDERLLFQAQTLQVRAWYLRYGLQAANMGKEPDDHVGLELSFIAHLAQLGLKAVEQEQPAALDDALDAQRRFLLEHLLYWAPAWCDIVISSARTRFYRGIALLAQGALAELAALLHVEPGGGRAR